jgi:hypothetical protein
MPRAKRVEFEVGKVQEVDLAGRRVTGNRCAHFTPFEDSKLDRE